MQSAVVRDTRSVDFALAFFTLICLKTGGRYSFSFYPN